MTRQTQVVLDPGLNLRTPLQNSGFYFVDPESDFAARVIARLFLGFSGVFKFTIE